MDVTADSMTLSPDAGLLTDADTVYPVYIDPVVKTATRTGWTMVSSHYSSTSFWKFDDDEGVGLCPSDVSVRCSSFTDVKRQFFAIPTGSFAGRDIVSAEFAVTQVFTYGSSAREVQLARVNSTGASAISSNTDWANQPSSKTTIGTKSPTDNAGSCTSTNQNVRFDVQSTIQTASDKAWDTTTFRLKAGSESDTSYWKRFCCNAHLEVTYNRPPLEPVQDDLQMKPGGTCEYGAATEQSPPRRLRRRLERVRPRPVHPPRRGRHPGQQRLEQRCHDHVHAGPGDRTGVSSLWEPHSARAVRPGRDAGE
ncbi:DNRLRE domain-containing protein [Streptomyces sp. NPDC101234]|uniref:DNRLRE domain-containing protein n=1 Tax=Streptomyces sp. NPDC101234 TaxID=3366138 RepID=UPI003802FB80